MRIHVDGISVGTAVEIANRKSEIKKRLIAEALDCFKTD